MPAKQLDDLMHWAHSGRAEEFLDSKVLQQENASRSFAAALVLLKDPATRLSVGSLGVRSRSQAVKRVHEGAVWNAIAALCNAWQRGLRTPVPIEGCGQRGLHYALMLRTATGLTVASPPQICVSCVPVYRSMATAKARSSAEHYFRHVAMECTKALQFWQREAFALVRDLWVLFIGLRKLDLHDMKASSAEVRVQIYDALRAMKWRDVSEPSGGNKAYATLETPDDMPCFVLVSGAGDLHAKALELCTKLLVTTFDVPLAPQPHVLDLRGVVHTSWAQRTRTIRCCTTR